MRAIVLAHQADWPGWRDAARSLAAANIPPEEIAWSVGAPDDLFADPAAPPLQPAAFTVPRAFVDLAETVIMAADPARFALLYRLLFRIRTGERHLMELATDPDLIRAQSLAHAVRRDIHKMRAFLRFRAVEDEGETRYVAWFEPSHHILAANAPFFVRRFATMVWSILTPEASAHWTGETLHIGPGASPADVPDDDKLEEYWRAYFAAIFNPARLKISAMLSEMPRKYWRNLPEARAIPELISTAAERTKTMIAAPPTQPRPTRVRPATPQPEPANNYERLAREAATCRACPLWEPATQTVFGEGAIDAAIMLVGEQPGDQEDLEGRPFVGPAGQVLNRALADAGIERQSLYITNAVKHFKFTPRGKRRIHEKPTNQDIAACRFWLDREQSLIRPKLTVALGASAARALLGRTVTISRERGTPITLKGGAQVLITVHPSYLLRLPDEASKQREYAAFVADLRLAAASLETPIPRAT
jgi:probable DNA metabolism protein